MHDSLSYGSDEPVAAELSQRERAAFITRTYGHLVGAVMAFVILELLYFRLGWAEGMFRALTSTSWLLVLGGFMVVGMLASRFAASARSPAAQYAGLALYVLAESIIFAPLLLVANLYAPGAITSAALITVLGFGGLTAVVLVTRQDFSFLRGVVMWGGIVALLMIVGGVIFHFNLGTFFSVAMVALAGASILYNTSTILHQYPADRHVAAALSLFASVALLFWYVLRLVMASRR